MLFTFTHYKVKLIHQKYPPFQKNILQTQLSHEKTVAYFPSDTGPWLFKKGSL